MTKSDRPTPHSKLSIATRYGCGALFSTLWIPTIVVSCAVSTRPVRNRIGPALQRVWGRTMMAIGGVRLEIAPSVQAMLDAREGRVLASRRAHRSPGFSRLRQPVGRHTPLPLPGIVRVTALPPIDLSEVPSEALRDVAVGYMEALARGPDGP